MTPNLTSDQVQELRTELDRQLRKLQRSMRTRGAKLRGVRRTLNGTGAPVYGGWRTG